MPLMAIPIDRGHESCVTQQYHAAIKAPGLQLRGPHNYSILVPVTQYHDSAPSTATCPFGQPLVACEKANSKANAITNIAIRAKMMRPIGCI